MDWKDLAGPLIKLGAPTLGTVVGGPLGGALGKVLADAFDTDPTPEAVSDALDAPGAAEKLATAEVAWAETVKVGAQEVNQTMREEIKAGIPWWHWRHLLGYAVTLVVLMFAVTTVKDIWSNDYVGVDAAVKLITAATPMILGMLTLLGAVAYDNTRRDHAERTGQLDAGLIGALVKRVAGKK